MNKSWGFKMSNKVMVVDECLAKSDFFDSDWYKYNYKDVHYSEMRPEMHFAKYGVLLERHPNKRVKLSHRGEGEIEKKFFNKLEKIKGCNLGHESKALLVRSLLFSVSDSFLIEFFDNVFKYCALNDLLEVFYGRVKKFVARSGDENVDVEIIKDLVLVVMKMEKDEEEKRKAIFSLLYLAKKNKLVEFDFIFQALIDLFGYAKAKDLAFWGVGKKDVKSDSGFFSKLYSYPRLMNLYTEEEVLQCLELVNTHQAVLSAYIYFINEEKSIPISLIRKAFLMKSKYKKGLVKELRRYTSSLKKLVDVDVSEVKNFLSGDENDFVLMEYFGIKGRCDLMPLNFFFNFENEEKFIFCVTPVEEREKKFREYIGLILSKNEVSPPGFSPFGKGLKKLFSNIVRENVKAPQRDDSASVLVIMSTHNPDVELLKLSLLSLEAQDYSNIKVVVVDDASENGEEIRCIMESFKDFYYVRNEGNIGVYASRNFAISEFSADYIAFQDDDDVSHPQRISHQVGVLESTGAKVGAVSHIRFDSDGYPQLDNGETIISDGPVTMLIKKEVFNEIGLFKPYKSRGDVEFRSRCVKYFGEEGYFQEQVPLYYAYGSEGTLSTRFERSEYYSHVFQRRVIDFRERG